MKIDAFGSGLELHRTGARARGIADAGFDGLWIAEAGRTAYLTCAATALAAPELDLGTAGAVAFRAARWSRPRSPGCWRRRRAAASCSASERTPTVVSLVQRGQ